MNLNWNKDDSDNKKKVFNIIYNEKGISRNKLKERTGLSLTTITKFVAELIDEGVVEENGTYESTGGRKSLVLDINPDFAYVLSIDLGGYSTKIGIIKLNGDILKKWVVPTNHKIPSSGFDIGSLSKRIEEIFAECGKSKFIGIGIGVSGIVDYAKGKIIFCPNIEKWNEVEIVDVLKRKFNLPVFLDTSSRSMALAEQWYGLGRKISDQIFISLGGQSIGAGIIINNQIFRGRNGFAGEFGHVQVAADNDLRCLCGNFGCLELYATMPMIMDRIKNIIRNYSGYSPLKTLMKSDDEDINLDIVLKALEGRDKIVNEVLLEAGRLTGIALANTINLLNPEMVIFGGGVIENFPIVLEKIKTTVKEKALITGQKNLSIVKSSLSWDASIIGPAILVIKPFIE